MRRILTAITAVLMMVGFSAAALAQSTNGATHAGSSSTAAASGDHGHVNKTGNCEDGLDNDGDELVDTADPACQQPGCQPSTQQPNKCNEEDDGGGAPDDCADGIDNDNDGFTDADDPDCQEGGSGDEVNDDSELDDCADGIDNDNDGFTDADDPDCQEGGSGDEVNDDSELDDCADGIDNDNDGFTDADDPDCQDGGSGNEDSDDSVTPGTCTVRGLGIVDNADDGADADDTLAYGILGTEDEHGPISSALHDAEPNFAPLAPLDSVVHEVVCVVATVDNNAAP